LGWKSADAEFALATGEVKLPGAPGGRATTVDDTFLFGSGVKPFISTAIMAMRDRGLVSLDDPLERHIDGVLEKLKPRASLRKLFGESAAKITVGHVLRMQSGVQDFDLPEFDNYLLRENETYRDHSPYEFIEYASTRTPRLVCEPGTCVSYSSNNFVLAGFLLLAHANVTNWWELDVRAFVPSDASRAGFGNLFFAQKEPLNEKLTVPGHTGGGWAQTPELTIWNQSSSVLGWTCGNLGGTALDVAKFIWGLLGPDAAVLPRETVEEMKGFRPLDIGWAAGFIQYGTGLMIESVRFTPGRPPMAPDWGTYMGHGGDTFGFLSEQGIVSGLNASVSIVAASDTDLGLVSRNVFCRMIKIAAKVITGTTLFFPCLGEEDVVVV